MKAPSSLDKGESARLRKKLCSGIFLLPVLFMFANSCNQTKKEIKKEQPVIDSTVIKPQHQSQQHKTDSLTKVAVHKKKIYLTFDDGPNQGTMNLLNAVKEDSIPASFFIVGKHVFDKPEQTETWKQLQSDHAIELCNHSYSHALNHYKRYYQHPGSVIKDLIRNQQQLGFKCNIVRMPGRNAWRIDSVNRTDIKESKKVIDSVHKAGFAVIGWDVEWMFDHKTLSLTTGADLLLRQIHNRLEAGKTRTKDHLVLLAHDQAFQSDSSVYLLHYLFNQLKANPEYELELISNYPGIKHDIH